MPKISVIVPIYKVEAYLRQCVESILKQTYTNFELILVDDGSPDRCPIICDEYAKTDDRVIVVHKQNGGLSSARNAGLNAATGDYVLFVDSDDYIDPTTIESCVTLIQSLNCDALKFEYKIVRGLEKPVKSPNNIKDSHFQIFTISDEKKKNAFLLEYLFTYKVKWESWSWLIKKSVIDEHNLRFYDNKIIFAEDLYFSLLLIMYCEKIVISDLKLYNYRLRNGSIMQRANSSKINELNNLSKFIYELLKEDFKLDEYYKIHFEIISNRFNFMPHLNNFSALKQWKTVIKNLRYKEFFKENNLKYYRYIKRVRHKDGVFFSTELIRNRYISTFNGLVCFFEIIVYKFFNIFRKEK